MNTDPIQTYVINLKNRTDRKQNILKEFSGKNEFDVKLVEAQEHQTGAIGLWITIKKILRTHVHNKNEYLILCEDDHQFTKFYSHEELYRGITSAQKRNADILLGGVSWFNEAIEVEKSLFWVKRFTGLQFTVIFAKFIDKILAADFAINDDADHKLSVLTQKKFLVFPYISNQKEFGYSDVTTKNNQTGHVEKLFANSLAVLQRLNCVSSFYNNINAKHKFFLELPNFESLTIPTYSIYFSENAENIELIQRQFASRPEFDVTMVPAVKHEIESLRLLLSIQQIVKLAIKNNDDIIIICEESHQFTENYNRDFLFRNIFETYQQGCTLLLGGVSDFNLMVPISKETFWVNAFRSTTFMIFYKEIFKRIEDASNCNQIETEVFLSNLAINKKVLFPFISSKRILGYSALENASQDTFPEAVKRIREIIDIKATI